MRHYYYMHMYYPYIYISASLHPIDGIAPDVVHDTTFTLAVNPETGRMCQILLPVSFGIMKTSHISLNRIKCPELASTYIGSHGSSSAHSRPGTINLAMSHLIYIIKIFYIDSPSALHNSI